MASNTSTHILCQCCMLALVNADESACRDYYQHDHPSCRLVGIYPTEELIHREITPLLCDGCERPAIGVDDHYWLAEG